MVSGVGKEDGKRRSSELCHGVQASGTKRTEPNADASFPEAVVIKTDSPDDDRDSVSVVGSCLALTSVRASEVRDFYRGYALVAVIAVVFSLAFFAVGILP
ncbi:hypothetical protein [Cupriavidus necator]